MKQKKRVHGSVLLPGQQSADYVVGQVSGSLFHPDSGASGSLSALFSSTAQSASLQFRAAPQPVQRSTHREDQQDETSEVQDEPKQKKKPPRKRPAADLKLQNRESGLQEADDDEKGLEGSTKRKKSKTSGTVREKDAEHWVMKRQRLKASRPHEALKSKRTVFVGNLPVSCTEKKLRSLFRDKGPIESVRFRSVVREDPSVSRKVAVITRKVHPQKQSLNAYVVFKQEESVVNALERNGMEIEKDFHIRVDRVTDSSAHDHKRSVFVGNLSFEIKESAFRRHFETCGTVEAVRLVRDKNSGLGKGFGYVLFETADSVQLALELDGSKLEGRSIRVKRSVRKDKQNPETRQPPLKGSVQKRPAPGGFRSTKKLSGNQQKSTNRLSSFKGEMVDPQKRCRKTGQKKTKRNKTVHI